MTNGQQPGIQPDALARDRAHKRRNVLSATVTSVVAMASVVGSHLSAPPLASTSLPPSITTPGVGSLDVINGCPMSGKAVNALQIQANPLKNRYTLPTLADIDPTVTLDKMLAPTSNPGTELNENKAATIEGYILEVKAGGIESCNCGTDIPQYMDTHIYVTRTPNPPLKKKEAIIVEITPRLRALMQGTADWSTQTLINQYPPGTKVKITGWLFYDKEHEESSENNNPGKANNWRGTCWEIHPVTSIEPEQNG